MVCLATHNGKEQLQLYLAETENNFDAQGSSGAQAGAALYMIIFQVLYAKSCVCLIMRSVIDNF